MGFIKFFRVLAIATTTLFVVCNAADAGEFRDPTPVWVKIKAEPGEARWHACRRVYQHDVFRVRRGPGNTMWCYVEYSRAYDYGERRQNFNFQ